jgi:quinol monooxygenase YgiN
MIVEYIRYEIENAQAEAFMGAYERAADCLRVSPHCLGYELTRCTEAQESFILRILWDSAEGHLTGFRKGPDFKPFLAAIQPYIPAIKEMRHYARTPVAWSRERE